MKHKIISLSLLGAGVAFGLGITLPLVRFEKLYFFSETPSLVELIAALWSEGNLWIAALVACFSIIFPLVKMVIVFNAAVSRNSSGFPRWLSYLSKWSMMDVILVALVIFGAKTSGVATAIAQPGIWFYALAALFSVVAAELLKTADN
jgi:paraquat-inducible protein A